MSKYRMLARDASSGQLKEIKSVKLNVLDPVYGAFNDGTNASATTAAINAAISDALAAGGQQVYLPAGTYLVNSTINLTGGVTLVGDGMEKTIIYSTTNQIILNLLEGDPLTSPYAYKAPTLRDLQVKGSKTAGSNQIGIKCEAAGDYMLDACLENIKILNCGMHGLWIKKAFSSRFTHIYSSDHAGYPFVFDVQNMPGNHYEGLYAGDVNSSYPAGFRVLSGIVALKSCNGINNSSSNSYWAIIGQISSGGFDSTGANVSAGLFLKDCNLESSKAGGVLSYYCSTVVPEGDTSFVGHGGSFGVYKPIHYVGINSGEYPPFFAKATLGDKIVFANSYHDTTIAGTVSVSGTSVTGSGTNFTTALVVGGLITISISSVAQTRKIASITNGTSLTVTEAFVGTTSGANLQRVYYAEGCAVHANDLPPLTTSGEGAKITQGPKQNLYYNTTNARKESLMRNDGKYPSVTVTGSETFNNPGTKYFEVNMTSNGTLSLPWAGWYETSEFIYIHNKSDDNVVVTIAPSSGTINGQSAYKVSRKGQFLKLRPNPVTLDYTVVNLTNTDRINVKDFGALGDGTTNDTTPVANAKTAALALGVPLYFPRGDYLIDGLYIENVQSVRVYGDSPLKSRLVSNDNAQAVLRIHSGTTYSHTVLIENLGIVGAGSGSSNHGIHITQNSSFDPSNYTIRNVTINNITGHGIYVPSNLFTQLYEGVDISILSGGGNGFDVLGSNDCIFTRCYVHSVGTSKSAYRIHSGVPTFIGCNGIDSGTTANWGTFGDKTADDGADRYVRAILIGTNIEDFTATGIKFKAGSTGSFIGTSIIAPSSGSGYKALEFEFVDDSLGGMFDSASSISSKGGTWANLEPVHSSGLPFIQIGNRELTTYRDTNVGASTSIPGITGTLLAGTTDYALTFDGVARAKDRLIFNEVASIATPPANCVAVAAKDVSGTSGLFLKNDSGVEVQIGAGTTFANPSASIGLSANNGSATTAMRSDATPALSQSITPTWSALHTFNLGTTPSNALLFDIAAPGSDGQRDSHSMIFRGRSRSSSTPHAVEFKLLTDVTSDAGNGAFTIQYQLDTGGFGTVFSVDQSGFVSAGAFQGDGSALTNLDAAQIVSGGITSSGMTMSTARLLGRSTASTGVIEEITIGSGLSLSSGVLSATGGGGSGITWSEVTGTTQTMAVDTAYIANNASQVVFTLPSTAAVGKVVRVAGKGAGGWRIAQNSGNIIHVADLVTTTGTGGYVESIHRRDAIELVCVVANTEWNMVSSVGTTLTIN